MAKPKWRIRKYQVTPYQKKALEYLRPPEDISVSEWAEKYRVLDTASAIPGPWKNSKTPYLVEIMNTLLDSDIEEIVFVKPTQVGGTEAMLNMLAYIAAQDPAPTLAVYPSDELGEKVVKKRIRPMIYASPPLRQRFRASESSTSELFFEGMSITVTGSGSPSQLASFAMRNLFLDEVDKYPGASKKESDPISLARERTKTFRNNRKIYITSTPTLKTGHIWKALEGADIVKHYFVPCPHCGKFIELKWAQVKFPDDEKMSYADRAEFAAYVCQECDAIITDRDKPEMLKHGEWRIVEQRTQFPRKVAFWLNTLYSPFVRFSEMAKEFLTSKDDPEKFQNFTNSWLAEPWEDTKLKTNADLVLERQTALQEYTVPEWAKVLTAGVDVQETCVYWTIRAWGNYLTSQNIAHGQAGSFAEVERIMNLQYLREGTGDPLVVALALIDSGDNTDLVYDFCASNSDWAMPSKGSSHPMDTHFRLSKVNRTDSKAYGMPLAIIDTGKYKDMIAGRMRKENGTGSWMVYAGCDRTYADQVTAEHKINVKTAGGRTVQSWVLKTSHGDNHFLDCEVYAMCAADMIGARTFHLQEIEVQPRTETKQDQTFTPEENWIAQNDDWLGG
ncbi:phage terminase large subunit family protein [Clostridiaceae bacterium]|nr:phage terminase large subunit family protein [Clostridiaceae bacterium]NBI81264.1 phage terminase large subunit family protein [Clostridiaceae bacterium]